MVKVNTTKYICRKKETSQNSLPNENIFLRLSVLKLLSAQVMRTSHGSLTTEKNLLSPRPAASVRLPAAATRGSCSPDSVIARGRPCQGCQLPVGSAAWPPRTRPPSPRVPANPRHSCADRKPPGSRGRGQWHITPARPGTPVTQASAQGLQLLHEHNHGCGGLTLTNYFCKCSTCCSRGK